MALSGELVSLRDVAAFPVVGVGEGRLSCDGRRVAYVAEGVVRVRQIETNEERAVGRGRHPRWSPQDADCLAYLDPDLPGVRLYSCVDLSHRQLAGDIGYVDMIAWSPAGERMMAITTRNPGNCGAAENDRSRTIVDVGFEHPSYVTTLSVIAVDTGRVLSCMELDAGTSVQEMGWHPQGDWVSLNTLSCPTSLNFQLPGLLDVSTWTGERRWRIEPGMRRVGWPAWSPDGRTLAFPFSPSETFCSVHCLCALMDRDGSEIRTFDVGYQVRTLVWQRDNRTLLGVGTRGVSSYVFTLDTVSGNKEVLSSEPGDYVLEGRAFGNGRVLVSYQGPKTVRDLYLVSPAAGRWERLTDFAAGMSRFRLSEPQRVTWQARDGLSLEAYVIPPQGSPFGRPYPTVVHLHGGPLRGRGEVFRPEWQFLASQGFQVFLPVLRSSQCYGRFPTPTVERDCEDILGAAEWLVHNGLCMENRLALDGWSYGASLGGYIIGQTKRFSAAILWGGDYLLCLGYGFSEEPAREPGAGENGHARPWEVPRVCERLAPIAHAHEVQTPLLLFQGEHDGIDSPWTYCAYLKSLGRTAELVMYKGEGHGLHAKEHIEDRWRRTVEWLRRYLG